MVRMLHDRGHLACFFCVFDPEWRAVSEPFIVALGETWNFTGFHIHRKYEYGGFSRGILLSEEINSWGESNAVSCRRDRCSPSMSRLWFQGCSKEQIL